MDPVASGEVDAGATMRVAGRLYCDWLWQGAALTARQSRSSTVRGASMPIPYVLGSIGFDGHCG